MARNRRLGPFYNETYLALKFESPFLNPKARERSFQESGWHLEGKNQLQARLKLFKAETLAEHEDRVAALEQAFKRASQKAVNEGRRPLTEMPSALRRQWEVACARLDVAKEERDAIAKAAEKVEVAEQERSDDKVLQYGAVGISKLAPFPDAPYGRLIRIDGQHVKPDAKGVPRIADARSPYNGMATADYIDYIVRPWKQANSLQKREKLKKAREQGIPQEKVRIGRAPLPPWPENIPRPEEAGA